MRTYLSKIRHSYTTVRHYNDPANKEEDITSDIKFLTQKRMWGIKGVESRGEMEKIGGGKNLRKRREKVGLRRRRENKRQGD